MDYTRLCPKCRNPVAPSDIEGYTWQCYDCDEDFYDFECYKAIPVCVFCDTTPLYTEADLLIDNTCDLLFPEDIVRAYFTRYCDTDEDDPYRVTFEDWYENLYTAADTDDLYDFALSRGFTATRPSTRKEN